MEITLEEFQEASKERKVAPGRRPQPYTQEQKAFVVGFAQRELEAGSSKTAVLRILGISDGTLSKWMAPDKAKVRRGFRRVQLKSEAVIRDGLTLVTPSGYRIEGLSLESAAALLSALG